MFMDFCKNLTNLENFIIIYTGPAVCVAVRELDPTLKKRGIDPLTAACRPENIIKFLGA